jgi:tetratricopeptide (TPR) repeat protein
MVSALQLTAWTLLSKKDYEKAKYICASSLGMTKRLMGLNSTSVASSMVNLAIALMNTGHFNLGPENLMKNALKIFKSHLKSDKKEELLRQIGLTHLNLGNLYYFRGNDDLAEAEYEVVYQMYENDQSKGVEATAGLKNLGLIKWRKGHTKEAEMLLGTALFQLEISDKFGVYHAQTVQVRGLLNSLRDGQNPPPVTKTDSLKTRIKKSSTSLSSKNEN